MNRSVAIYGLGLIGVHLQKELLHSKLVNLKYIIDKGKKGVHNDIPVFDLNDNLPKVDAIIVTVMWDYNKIESELTKKMNSSVISIDTLMRG